MTHRSPRKWGALIARLTSVLLGAALLCPAPARADEALHYFAVENLATRAIEQRGATGSAGDFGDLILAPGTEYRIWVMRADNQWSGYVLVTSGGNGERVQVPPVVLGPSNRFDTDGDGLPELLETIVGTDPRVADTDGDGVPDGAEVVQGTNPLDGLESKTGVVAAVELPDGAVDVCAHDDRVVIAHGKSGVSVFNVFNRMNPSIIARVALGWNARRVACGGREIVAAGTNGWLATIDAEEPTAAEVTHQLPPTLLCGKATALAAADRLAYVGTDTGRVSVVDIPSGESLHALTLVRSTGAQAASVQDIALYGLQLYALTTDELCVVDIALAQPVQLVAVPSPVGEDPNRRLSVGGGVAYALHHHGYNTFDVSVPSSPSLITATDSDLFQEWFDLAINGSGSGVFAARANFDVHVHLFDTSDPALTEQFLATLPTPGAATGLEIFNGLAYVADGEGGLSVVSYLADDTGTVPPAIELTASFNIAAESPVAEEGARAFVRALVADDVQVRNVEFYIDGGLVATDGQFPFELLFTTPNLAKQSTFTVRARASDTRGNTTTTPTVTVTLQPDATPPVVVGVVPVDGASVPSAGLVGVWVNEPLDPATVTTANVPLVEAGLDGALGTVDDVLVTGGAPEYLPDALGVLRTFEGSLPAGLYRAAASVALTDTAGNPLAAAPPWIFVVYDAAIDTDTDGLPDGLEAALGLNPDVDDTDGDGDPDSAEDTDLDGISNGQELQLGSDPGLQDSDGDGISDGQEDGDADGLLDVFEAGIGTDPCAEDTDGDGIPDAVEVAKGTDPLDPGSVPQNHAPIIRTVVSWAVASNNQLQYFNFEVVVYDADGSASVASVAVDATACGGPTMELEYSGLNVSPSGGEWTGKATFEPKVVNATCEVWASAIDADGASAEAFAGLIGVQKCPDFPCGCFPDDVICLGQAGSCDNGNVCVKPEDPKTCKPPYPTVCDWELGWISNSGCTEWVCAKP